MGGMVAQLAWRRHSAVVSGLVLCATARNVLGSPAEKLAALTLPSAAAAIRWNPLLQPASPSHRSSPQILLQACWSVTPGSLAQPQSAG